MPSTDAPSEKTLEARRKTLAHIEAAQNQLSAAAQAACPLQGWSDEWTEIGDMADAVKAFWHKINQRPYPTGHDNE